MLFHGDCHELIKKIDTDSVQIVYIDPPYGITQQPWDKLLRFDELWTEFWRILKPNGAVIIHASIPYTIDIVNTQRKYFKYWWTWNKTRKTGFLNAKRQPLRNVEEICVFYQRQTIYNPQMIPLDKPRYRKNGTKRSNTVSKYNGGVVTVTSEDYPSTLLNFPANTKSIKPQPLCEYIIKTYTNPGDHVLDICMHTGISGVAALNINRKYTGFEINKEFYEKAVENIKPFSVKHED
jgi:site-specific DNA-methyltransferase (adenine-specific)